MVDKQINTEVLQAKSNPVGRAEYEPDPVECFERIPAKLFFLPALIGKGAGLVIGNPGSGKTYLFKYLASEVPTKIYELDKQLLEDGRLSFYTIGTENVPEIIVFDDLHYLLRSLKIRKVRVGAGNTEGQEKEKQVARDLELKILDSIEKVRYEAEAAGAKLLFSSDSCPAEMAMVLEECNRKRFLEVLDGCIADVDSKMDSEYFYRYLKKYYDSFATSKVLDIRTRGSELFFRQHHAELNFNIEAIEEGFRIIATYIDDAKEKMKKEEWFKAILGKIIDIKNKYYNDPVGLRIVGRADDRVSFSAPVLAKKRLRKILVCEEMLLADGRIDIGSLIASSYYTRNPKPLRASRDYENLFAALTVIAPLCENQTFNAWSKTDFPDSIPSQESVIMVLRSASVERIDTMCYNLRCYKQTNPYSMHNGYIDVVLSSSDVVLSGIAALRSLRNSADYWIAVQIAKSGLVTKIYKQVKEYNKHNTRGIDEVLTSIEKIIDTVWDIPKIISSMDMLESLFSSINNKDKILECCHAVLDAEPAKNISHYDILFLNSLEQFSVSVKNLLAVTGNLNRSGKQLQDAFDNMKKELNIAKDMPLFYMEGYMEDCQSCSKLLHSMDKWHYGITEGAQTDDRASKQSDLVKGLDYTPATAAIQHMLEHRLCPMPLASIRELTAVKEAVGGISLELLGINRNKDLLRAGDGDDDTGKDSGNTGLMQFNRYLDKMEESIKEVHKRKESGNLAYEDARSFYYKYLTELRNLQHAIGSINETIEAHYRIKEITHARYGINQSKRMFGAISSLSPESFYAELVRLDGILSGERSPVLLRQTKKD